MLKTVCVLAFAAAFAASAVHAEPMGDDPVKTRVVSVGDVNFADAQQVGRLYDRLKTVSKEVCDTTQPGPAWREADDRACEREAVQGAVRDLDQPLLTDVASQTEMAGTDASRSQAGRRETR